MDGGFVAVPLLESVNVSGVAVVLAGYLGVFSVLVSLFLIMGRIGGGDAARSFARGFAQLFAGEITGVLVGGVLGALPGASHVLGGARGPGRRGGAVRVSVPVH